MIVFSGCQVQKLRCQLRKRLRNLAFIVLHIFRIVNGFTKITQKPYDNLVRDRCYPVKVTGPDEAKSSRPVFGPDMELCYFV